MMLLSAGLVLKKSCSAVTVHAVHVFSDERLNEFCSRILRRRDLEVADVGKPLSSLAFLKKFRRFSGEIKDQL